MKIVSFFHWCIYSVAALFLLMACSNAEYETLDGLPGNVAEKPAEFDEDKWLEPVESSSSVAEIDTVEDAVIEPFLSSSSEDTTVYLLITPEPDPRSVDSVGDPIDDVPYEMVIEEPDSGLPNCTAENEGEITFNTKDEMYYICKESEWEYALVVQYDTYGQSCTAADIGKIVKGSVVDYSKYYCTENGWIDYLDWSWDVPKEARKNPEIKYDTLVDSRDGKIYRTITIASQTWMAENLNYADSVQTESLKGNSWCYLNDTLNCQVTGRLYSWAAAIDSVGLAENEALDCGYGKRCFWPDTIYGICPPGWHLPKEKEWKDLFNAVGGEGIAGFVLKSQNGWYLHGCGADSVGFGALPAGRKFVDDVFDYDGLIAYFWSASEKNEDYALFMGLAYDFYERAVLYELKKTYGFSVRCLKNSED